MEYAGSFFDLINSMENILGGCLNGGMIDAFSIGITPKSPEFAQWMTTPDPDIDSRDDSLTPKRMVLPRVENGGMDPELGMADISGKKLIPYCVFEDEDEICVTTIDDDGVEILSNIERSQEALGSIPVWLTEKMLTAKRQYEEDLERYNAGEIESEDIRNYSYRDGSIIVYALMVSDSDAPLSRGERPEAEFFIRVEHDHPYAHEAAWLAYAIIELFADKNGCKMKTVRPEDKGGY